MKCPKCGYQSFNNLTACKKCGRDLAEVQAKLNLGNPVIVPLPVQPPTEPPPAVTEIPVASAPTAVAVKEQNTPEDEHGLEDFFQSIDSQDQVPSDPPLDRQPAANTKERSTAKRQHSTEGPQWSQESPQGDFPFDELDSDLDALQLSRAAEPTADSASPFDDVDSFEINWQSLMEEEVIAEAEPVTASEPASEGQSTKEEWDLEELPTTTKPVTEQSEIVPSAKIIEPEPEPEPIETEGPTAPPITEQLTDDEDWPLPELPSDLHVEKNFALEEPCEPKTPAAEAPTDSAVPSEQPVEVQEELPLAAREIETPFKQANIAAIFLPDAEQDPIASGAQLLTRRAKAYLADFGLLTVIFAIFVCAGEVARSPATGERFQFTSDVLLDLATPYFLVFFALCFGYFTLFHYLSGQTPGKMIFDIRVEGDDHANITLAQAFLRCVGGLISLLPAGLGFLSIVLNGEQRGWNDQLAGCRVVMLEELDKD